VLLGHLYNVVDLDEFCTDSCCQTGYLCFVICTYLLSKRFKCLMTRVDEYGVVLQGRI